MSVVLSGLSIVGGIMWFAVAAQVAASFWRTIIGRNTFQYDMFRSLIFFFALQTLGYVFRWVIFPSTIQLMQPQELWFWAVLRSLTCLSGYFAFRVVRAHGKGQ